MSESTNGRVGQRVSNYDLVRLIGHGGFADVYLGEHIYLKTQAAVKILHIRAADADKSDILNEARAIAQLEHPHIVRLLEYGVEDDYPFLIMSYAAKGSLRHHYPKTARLPIELAITYAQQVASALDYAHQNKLIHRDVKPENMLIGQNDHLLLSDFGLVVMAQTSHSHSSDDLAGTVAYMAPEQLRGRPRFASDQYALGVVVYEWLCGKRPFVGSFAEVASQQMLESPPSLRAMLPDLSPEVERVVFKALAKNPTNRFESVGDFAYALDCAYNKRSCLPFHLSPLASVQQPTQLIDQSFKLQSSDQDSSSTLPLVTLSSHKQDSSAPVVTPTHNVAASNYNRGVPTPVDLAQVATGKQVSVLSMETITPDVPLPTFPTFQLSAVPRSAQAVPMRFNKSPKNILILAVLFLVLGGCITLGLNMLIDRQGVSVNSNQDHIATVPANGGAVSTVTVASPTKTLPTSTPTVDGVPTEHTLIPLIVPNVPTPTSAPAPTPIPIATPTSGPSSTPTVDPNSTPTSDPNATSTPDPNSTPTPDPNSTTTPGPNPVSTPVPSSTPTS